MAKTEGKTASAAVKDILLSNCRCHQVLSTSEFVPAVFLLCWAGEAAGVFADPSA